MNKNNQQPGSADKFGRGDTVRKSKGSQWSGKVVGFYSTDLTPEGYAVESATETGSVQIYPAAALELVERAPVSAVSAVQVASEPIVGATAWFHRGMVNFDAEDALAKRDDGNGTPIKLYLEPVAATVSPPDGAMPKQIERLELELMNQRELVQHWKAKANYGAMPEPGPWQVFEFGQRFKSGAVFDVVLKNGVTEYARTVQYIDWTQVADWQYSAAQPAEGSALVASDEQDIPCSVQLWAQTCYVPTDEQAHVMPPFAAPASQHGAWVAVKDRLPEPGETVLIAVQWHKALEDGPGISVGGGVYEGECRVNEHGSYMENYAADYERTEHITHWMPLPAMPDQSAASGFREGRSTQSQREPGQQMAAPERSDTPAPREILEQVWNFGLRADHRGYFALLARIEGDKQGAQGDA